MLTMSYKTSFQFVPILSPSNAKSSDITVVLDDGRTIKTVSAAGGQWISSDENVLSIDSSGKVTTKRAGTTTITLEVNDNNNIIKKEIKVTVQYRWWQVLIRIFLFGFFMALNVCVKNDTPLKTILAIRYCGAKGCR